MKKYDHIILGTGQATGTLLGELITKGDSIAVIEGNKVGGSCVNYGCTPTKTLVACAKAIYQAGRGEFYGFTTGEIKINYDRVRERMNEIRYGSSKGLENWMNNTDNVTLIKEWGEFTGPKTIRIGDKEIAGEKIYINTGTRAFVPPVDGIDSVSWMDSAGLLDLEELPKHLLIIGGGYIGVEFSQIFRRFGSEVTIIQRSDQLMPREDADVANSIREFLEEEGIEVLYNSEADSVTEVNGKIVLNLKLGKSISGSHLLIAAGRKPNSERLNPKAADLKLDKRGYIKVDDFCRTGVDGVFAVGDVNGEGAFTHTSVNDAEIVLDF